MPWVEHLYHGSPTTPLNKNPSDAGFGRKLTERQGQYWGKRWKLDGIIT